MAHRVTLIPGDGIGPELACNSSRSRTCTTCSVLPNLYGDIVSDLAAGLVGGLGVAPGANIGTEAAVFEPVHGSAPKYAGMNNANPTALILSGALMLRHLGHPDAAPGVENAVRDVIAEGLATTYDLGGSTGTSEFADAIIQRLGAGSSTAAALATSA